ncbi:MAG TPA: DMT family transporter [Thiobacillaceae bacterium]|nr:DMT family transporter [Thiobacillaceae bacterium]
MQAQSARTPSIGSAYLGVVAIWSTTPLGIVWSGQGVHFTVPLFVRMSIGLAVCGQWLLLNHMPLPLGPNARKSYLYAGVSIWASMLCTYWGAQFIPSGLISVVFGLSPILTGLFAWLWLREDAFTPLKLMGMVFGLAGLVIIFGDSMRAGQNGHRGIAAVLLAVALQAWGLVAVKRVEADISAMAQTTGALAVTVLLSGLSLLLLGAWPTQVPVRSVLAMLYLGVFGSAIGFSLYYYLIKQLEAGRVALITLITPATALFLGMALNGERLSLRIVAGSALILLGLLLYEWKLLVQASRS